MEVRPSSSSRTVSIWSTPLGCPRRPVTGESEPRCRVRLRALNFGETNDAEGDSASARLHRSFYQKRNIVLAKGTAHISNLISTRERINQGFLTEFRSSVYHAVWTKEAGQSLGRFHCRGLCNTETTLERRGEAF